MSEATLARVFERLVESPYLGEQLTVAWHAGEPLVLGVSYYEKAFALIEGITRGHVRVDHSFQTNGTLLDERWIEFFKRTNAGLGISIDGPRHIHDANRKTRSGRGTFDGAMRAVALLNEAHLPFHVISVLTDRSIHDPDGLFCFYRDNGIREVGFNIDEIEGTNERSSLADAEAETAVGAFFRRLLALSADDPTAVSFREFAGATAAILGASAGPNQQTEPLRIVTVGVDGRLSTFSPELLGFSHERYGDFAFGSVHEMALKDIFMSPEFLRVWDAIDDGVSRCRETCQYFSVCGGGAPANKLFENGGFDTTETLYCRLTKKLVIDYVLTTLESRLPSPNQDRRFINN